jgi:uncharacterized membrane protein
MSMLTFLNLVQLILYIALLSLLAQGLLFLIAGAKRESNFFYKLLQVVGKPFTVPLRWMMPRQVADRHVPILAFFLLALLYLVVTIEKINHCVSINMAGCK